MKRLLIAVALTLSAASASAQVYVSEGLNYVSPSVGYRFGRYFSAEVGYVAPRDTDATMFSGVPGPVPKSTDSTAVQTKWETKGWKLSAIASLPLLESKQVGDSLWLLAKGSVYALKGTETVSSSTVRTIDCGNPIGVRCPGEGVVAQSSVSRSASSTDFGLGLGAEWRFNQHLSIRAFYEKMTTPLSAEGKINMSIFEVTYTF